MSQQAQPTIHTGHLDIEGGSSQVDRSAERQNKSPESHLHSANSSSTSHSPTASISMGDSGLPRKADASAHMKIAMSGSWDKPGNAEPTAAKPGFVDRMTLHEGSAGNVDSKIIMKDNTTSGESVRGPAELKQGDVDTDPTESDDGVNNAKKEVMELKRREEREADLTTDSNVTENFQQSKVQPPFNSASQKDTGNKLVGVGNVSLFAVLALIFKEHFFPGVVEPYPWLCNFCGRMRRYRSSITCFKAV